MTDHLVATGLRDAGFAYVNLDDCWMSKMRDNVTGQLVAGHQFPHGMAALGQMIHQKQLKFGLYSDRGFRTCQALPGLLDNEVKDVATMASWGIDFLKNDGCYTASPHSEGGLRGDPSAAELYGRTQRAIDAAGQSVCNHPSSTV